MRMRMRGSQATVSSNGELSWRCVLQDSDWPREMSIIRKILKQVLRFRLAQRNVNYKNDPIIFRNSQKLTKKTAIVAEKRQVCSSVSVSVSVSVSLCLPPLSLSLSLSLSRSLSLITGGRVPLDV